MTTAAALLPAEFADLEPFAADWSLPREPLRYARRLSSSMEELRTFHDAVVPRAKDAIDHLDQYPLDDMPEPAVRLLWLLQSFITISFAVDIFKQQRIPDAGSAYLDIVVEPLP